MITMMTMMAKYTMRRVAKSCQKGLIKCMPSAMRSLNSIKDDNNSKIVVSPPLVTLDVPEVWTPNSNPYQHLPPLNCLDEQTASVIDGKSIAEEIRSTIAREVRRMKEFIGKVPGLAVILVGERRDSQTYVRNKILACEEAGIKSIVSEFPEDCTEDEVLSALSNYNGDVLIHGILVQLPLPQHLDEGKILDAVRLEKDVDGFHPLNMGNLAMRGREPLFIPCTPKGCIELLIRSGVEIMGKNAVVIGRSNIVGLPTSLLLQVITYSWKMSWSLTFTYIQCFYHSVRYSLISSLGQRHHATVSIVHALTENPEQITSEADIVVAAAGVPNLVRGSWIKLGAVVLDVGTCPVEDPSCEYGYRLMGDVCYEEAVRLASAITPVPGGVGPMTIAMLLSNTLDSAKRAYNFI